ncbi:MAG: DUF6036 family nucleotidyltransferase [Nanoarchaeota archaeon]
MFNKEELDELLVKASSNIKRPIKLYMIGGCALSFRGLKPATKDIDIIVTSKEDFDAFDQSMKENGFTPLSERESDFYAAALVVYKKGESRIDVFLNQVGKMLFLSENMIKRTEKYKEYGSLAVYLVSNEDIFLFKAMTSREGDIYDCDRIMKEGIDYEIIYNEIVEQSKTGKKWFFWLYENLCRIENHNGIKTPIKNRVFALVKDYWEEKPADFMVEVDNAKEHIKDKRLLKDLLYREL